MRDFTLMSGAAAEAGTGVGMAVGVLINRGTGVGLTFTESKLAMPEPIKGGLSGTWGRPLTPQLDTRNEAKITATTCWIFIGFDHGNIAMNPFHSLIETDLFL